LADRQLHVLQALALMRVDVEDDAGAHGQRGNQRAFHYLVGRCAEQGAVLEGARFVLVTIAHHVFVVAHGIGGGFPFAPGRETGTAHAAQVGIGNLADDGAGRLECGLQAKAAACLQPGVQVGAYLYCGVE
jgi:hypothetical protein